MQHYCPRCNGSGKILDSKAVGEYLRQKRESFSNSLRLVASRMEISAPYLCDLERGKRNWTFELIEKFEECIVPEPLLKPGRTVWIYGLFNSKKECEYVGATTRPEDRKSTHSTTHRDLKLKFKILQKCDRAKAADVESALIKSYKEKGQCKLNKISHPVPCRGWEN